MLGHGESIWALLSKLFVNQEKVKLDSRFSSGQNFQNVIKKAVAVCSRPRGEIRCPVPFRRLRKFKISNSQSVRLVRSPPIGESFSLFAQVFTVPSARELQTVDVPGMFRIFHLPSGHLSGLRLTDVTITRSKFPKPTSRLSSGHNCSEKLHFSPQVPSEV